MASKRQGHDKHEISTDAAMAGVLALLVDEREARVGADKSATKTEVLLAKAGLSVEDVAAVTGKTKGAIQKSIERARK